MQLQPLNGHPKVTIRILLFNSVVLLFENLRRLNSFVVDYFTRFSMGDYVKQPPRVLINTEIKVFDEALATASCGRCTLIIISICVEQGCNLRAIGVDLNAF